MSLTSKAIRGAYWVSILNLTNRVIRFVTTVALARLLQPVDFGIASIAIIVMNVMVMFCDLGLGSALIFRKDQIEKAANTAFILFTIMGVVLTLMTFFMSPYIAGFFNSPESSDVIAVLALNLFFISLAFTPSTLLDKELDFKKQLIPEGGSILSYSIATIILAYNHFGVWSIVYGKVLSSAVWVILLFYVSPWRPKFEFDFGIAKEMWGYSRHILGTSLITFLSGNLDNVFVGKFLGAISLGFYSMAYNATYIPALSVTALVNRVMYPTFSKVREDIMVVKRLYLKSIKYVSVVSLPLTLGLLVLSGDVVIIVLGDNWLPALFSLQVLCVSSLFHSIRASTKGVFNALGRPELSEKYSLYQLVLFCVLVYPLTIIYGIGGTSLAVLAPTVILTFWGFRLTGKLVGISLREFFESVKTPLVASIMMAFIILFVRKILVLSGLLKLFILGGVGVVSFIVVVFLMDKELVGEIKKMMIKARHE